MLERLTTWRKRRRTSAELTLVGITAGVWRPAFDNWVEMAERFGYSYELIGRDLAEPYLRHATRWRLMADYLAEQEPDHIIFFLDATDAFVCDEPRSLLARYREYERPVVIGGGSGGCIGTAAALTDAVEVSFVGPDIATDEQETIVQEITEPDGSELEEHRYALENGAVEVATSAVHSSRQHGAAYNAFAQLYGLRSAELDDRGRLFVPWPLDVPDGPVTNPYAPGEPERIPRIVHYVHDGAPNEFGLKHVLAIRSCLTHVNPDEVFLHCSEEPSGRFWDEIASDVTVTRSAPSPVAPLDVLAKHGGIYAAFDSLFTDRMPGRYRRASFVIGRGADGLSTAVMMAKPNAAFAQAWRKKATDQISSDEGARLAQRMPDDVRVEPDGLDSVVVLDHDGPLDEEWVRTSDSAYARAARELLPKR